MDNLIENIPIAGQAMKFARKATKCAAPYQTLLIAAKGIVIDCLPPNIKYPFKCLVLVSQIKVAIVLTVASANQILDD